MTPIERMTMLVDTVGVVPRHDIKQTYHEFKSPSGIKVCISADEFYEPYPDEAWKSFCLWLKCVMP